MVLSLSGVATVRASFYGGTSVVELTGKTFDQVFADTNVWLVSAQRSGRSSASQTLDLTPRARLIAGGVLCAVVYASFPTHRASLTSFFTFFPGIRRWSAFSAGGHCQRLTPEFIKAADNVDGLAKMAAVNCDEDANKALCSKFGIQGFPTLKVLPWNAKSAAQAVDYQGARSAGSIAKYLLEQIPNQVTSVKDVAAWSKFVAKPAAAELKKVLLFSDKADVSTLYKSLAVQFHNRLAFAQASSKGALADQFKVTSAPTLMVLAADGTGEPSLFDGKLKPLTVGKFLAGFAPKLKGFEAKGGKKQADEQAEQQEDEDAAPRRSATPAQEELWRLSSGADYTARCQERPGTCVIAVLDPLGDDFKAQTDALTAALEKHKGGPMTFVWVDGFAQEKLLRAIGLFGADLPQLYFVNENRRASARYIGPFDGDAIAAHVDKLKLGTAPVQKLSDKVDIAGSFVTETAAKTEL